MSLSYKKISHRKLSFCTSAYFTHSPLKFHLYKNYIMVPLHWDFMMECCWIMNVSMKEVMLSSSYLY
jgi:hypothetical protein